MNPLAVWSRVSDRPNVAALGKDADASPEAWRLIDGKLYLLKDKPVPYCSPSTAVDMEREQTWSESKSKSNPDP